MILSVALTCCCPSPCVRVSFVKCECLNQYSCLSGSCFCQHGLECFWSLVTISNFHVRSLYLFETLMHTDRPSSDAHLTLTSPESLLEKSLTPIASLPQLPDTLCLGRPVDLSTCSCLNFPPVTLHTPPPALFQIPSSDIHKYWTGNFKPFWQCHMVSTNNCKYFSCYYY